MTKLLSFFRSEWVLRMMIFACFFLHVFLQKGKKKSEIRKNKSLFESVSVRINLWSFLDGTSEKPCNTLLSRVYENIGIILVRHEKNNLD